LYVIWAVILYVRCFILCGFLYGMLVAVWYLGCMLCGLLYEKCFVLSYVLLYYMWFVV